MIFDSSPSSISKSFVSTVNTGSTFTRLYVPSNTSLLSDFTTPFNSIIFASVNNSFSNATYFAPGSYSAFNAPSIYTFTFSSNVDFISDGLNNSLVAALNSFFSMFV